MASKAAKHKFNVLWNKLDHETKNAINLKFIQFREAADKLITDAWMDGITTGISLRKKVKRN